MFSEYKRTIIEKVSQMINDYNAIVNSDEEKKLLDIELAYRSFEKCSRKDVISYSELIYRILRGMNRKNEIHSLFGIKSFTKINFGDKLSNNEVLSKERHKVIISKDPYLYSIIELSKYKKALINEISSRTNQVIDEARQELKEIDQGVIQNVIAKKNDRISAIEESYNYLKGFTEDEGYFFLLIDSKISERFRNKTLFIDSHISDFIYMNINGDNNSNNTYRYQNYKQIQQALFDIESEYLLTEVCTKRSYEMEERKRLIEIEEELRRRRGQEIRKLKELRIKMIPDEKMESKDEEIENTVENTPDFNYKGKMYKRCPQCGEWHNAVYNRCAPCNGFLAKNDTR